MLSAHRHGPRPAARSARRPRPPAVATSGGAQSASSTQTCMARPLGVQLAASQPQHMRPGVTHGACHCACQCVLGHRHWHHWHWHHWHWHRGTSNWQLQLAIVRWILACARPGPRVGVPLGVAPATAGGRAPTCTCVATGWWAAVNHGRAQFNHCLPSRVTYNRMRYDSGSESRMMSLAATPQPRTPALPALSGWWVSPSRRRTRPRRGCWSAQPCCNLQKDYLRAASGSAQRPFEVPCLSKLDLAS